MKILISGCLLGINCKYDGKNNLCHEALELFRNGIAIPICPEQLGGQTTPREPHEIINATGAEVLDGIGFIKGPKGDEATKEFIRGAYETLKIAEECGAKVAILKARSPSCGLGKIYDGTFTGCKKDGNGVTAELLIRNDIEVYTEENITEFYDKYINL